MGSFSTSSTDIGRNPLKPAVYFRIMEESVPVIG
jgi:hypothetical protein